MPYVTSWERDAKEEGVKIGEKIGEKRGVKRGVKIGIRRTAENLLKLGVDMDKIAQATGLEKEEIEKMASKISTSH